VPNLDCIANDRVPCRIFFPRMTPSPHANSQGRGSSSLLHRTSTVDSKYKQNEAESSARQMKTDTIHRAVSLESWYQVSYASNLAHVRMDFDPLSSTRMMGASGILVKRGAPVSFSKAFGRHTQEAYLSFNSERLLETSGYRSRRKSNLLSTLIRPNGWIERRPIIVSQSKFISVVWPASVAM
jgi:hypothetical protein